MQRQPAFCSRFFPDDPEPLQRQRNLQLQAELVLTAMDSKHHGEDLRVLGMLSQ